MFTISAFADEISPDPQEQIDVLSRCGVKHIELRSIHKTNVLDLTDLQVSEFKSLYPYSVRALNLMPSVPEEPRLVRIVMTPFAARVP